MHQEKFFLFATVIVVLLLLADTSQLIAQPQLYLWNVTSRYYPKISIRFRAECSGDRLDFFKENYSVKENGQPVSNFTLKKFCPRFAILFDRSASMAPYFTQMKTTAKALVDLFDSSCSQMMLLSFADSVRLDVAATTSKQLLKNAIDALPPGGNNKIVWDATYYTIEAMSQQLTNNFPGLVLITDGNDNASILYNTGDCISEALNRRIQIQTVGIGSTINQQDLLALSDGTAGLYTPSPQNCSDWLRIYNLPHLTTGEGDYEIEFISTLPLCPDQAQRTIEITAGVPSGLYCCQGAATMTTQYKPPYNNYSIRMTLDTTNIYANKQGRIYLSLIDSINGEFHPAQFKIAFDTSLSKLTGIVTTGYLLEGIPISFQHVSDGVIISTTQSACINGKGILASLTFRASAQLIDTECPLQLMNWQFTGGRFTAQLQDGLIRILSHWVRVASPNGGESFCRGETMTIDWQSSRVDTVDIELIRDGATLPGKIIAYDVADHSYQWTIPPDVAPHTGYRVRIKDATLEHEDKSDGLFSLNTAPVLLSSPSTQIVCEGATVLFTANAVALPLPDAQWQVSSDLGKTWEDMPGEIRSDLRLQSAQRSYHNDNRYRVRFTNQCGAVVSEFAKLTVHTPVSILDQSYDTTICAGSTAQFSSQAYGIPTPSIQWQMSSDGGSTWNEISGQVMTVLTLLNVQSAQSNTFYRAKLSNSCTPFLVSRSAKLTVIEPPTIAQQPRGMTVCIGNSAQLTVAATGSPLAFQWYRNGLLLPGETLSQLKIDSAKLSDAGYYQVEVMSDCATPLMSNSAFVGVNTPPIILLNPQSLFVCAGRSASFKLSHQEKPPAQVQWQISTDRGTTFLDIAGAIEDSITLSKTTLAMDGNLYRARLSNTCGTITTSSSRLNVSSQTPTITSQPKDQILCEGDSLVVRVGVTGIAAYQWFKNGSSISGAQSDSYIIANTQLSDSGLYRVTITDGCGQVVSNDAHVSIIEQTRILSQPNSIIVKENDSARFSIFAAGRNLSYQWMKDGISIPNATSSIFTILSVKKNDEGDYLVIASGQCGTPIQSNTAHLSVSPLTDVTAQQVPSTTRIRDIFPNPFRDRTTISFDLDHSQRVMIEVHDVFGSVVAKIHDGEVPPGTHSISWYPFYITPGVYYLRITTDHLVDIQKMILLR